MSNIVMLSGKAQAGKDSFCTAMLECLEEGTVVGKRYSFADHLKSLATLYGWNGSKEGEGRSLLIDLGQIARGDYNRVGSQLISTYSQEEVVRETYDILDLYSFVVNKQGIRPNKDYWVSLVANQIEEDRLPFAIISDWRFLNEYNFIAANFDNVFPIRITRSNSLTIDDRSETELDKLTEGFLPINNNGSLLHLKQQAALALSEIEISLSLNVDNLRRRKWKVS